MTAPAIQQIACPKCGSAMWDNRGKKTNPKAPDFKCKTATCDGVIWPPRGAKPVAPAPAPFSHANKPESAIPELLRDVPARESADLHAKIAPDVLATLQTNLAVYQALTEWTLREIEPLYRKADVGWSPEAATAAVATLYINAVGKK